VQASYAAIAYFNIICQEAALDLTVQESEEWQTGAVLLIRNMVYFIPAEMSKGTRHPRETVVAVGEYLVHKYAIGE